MTYVDSDVRLLLISTRFSICSSTLQKSNCPLGDPLRRKVDLNFRPYMSVYSATTLYDEEHERGNSVSSDLLAHGHSAFSPAPITCNDPTLLFTPFLKCRE